MTKIAKTKIINLPGKENRKFKITKSLMNDGYIIEELFIGRIFGKVPHWYHSNNRIIKSWELMELMKFIKEEGGQ